MIYVDLLESNVTKDPSAGAEHAVATARIRVVDVKTGNTLWPTDSSHGKEMTASMDYDPADPSHTTAMHTDMLAKLSSKISKLFYDWHADNQYEEDSGG